VRKVHIAIDLLTPGERRDLANALLRAAWRAALEETRLLLLDLALATDEQLLWAFAWKPHPTRRRWMRRSSSMQGPMRHVLGRDLP
jgi:hypothetical protein